MVMMILKVIGTGVSGEGIEVDQEIEKIEIIVDTKKKRVLPVKKIRNIKKIRNTRKTKRRRKTVKNTSRIGRKRQCSEERSTYLLLECRIFLATQIAITIMVGYF